MEYRISELPHQIFADHQKALDKLVSEDIGVEGVGIFTSLLDFFGRIANNFKTYLGSAFRNFKRSELEAYTQSHTFAVKNLFGNKFIDFYAVQVPVPDGMIGTYPDVVKYVLAWSKMTKIEEVLDLSTVYFRQYESIGVDDYRRLSNETKHLEGEVSKIKKAIVEKDLQKYFVAKHTRDLKVAGLVIGDLGALTALHGSVNEFAKDYRLAQRLIAKVEYVEAAIGQIVQAIQQSPHVDPTYLRALHALVTVLAVQIDMFGALLDYEQRIEHNYVLALSAIINTAK